jgi:hypothetical protein
MIKISNDDLLKNIQKIGSSGTDQYFLYVIDNGTFHIHVLGGEIGFSVPDEMLENLSDYKLVTVKIWDHKEYTLEDKTLDDSLESIMFPGGILNPSLNISFNRNVFSHVSIDIKNDVRFIGQIWTKDFSNNTSHVSVDILCDIVRYCNKISDLKAFW